MKLNPHFKYFRKALDVIGPSRVRKAACLLPMMIAGSMLEVLGIGLVLPVITILISPAGAPQNEYLQRVGEFLGNPSETTLTFILLGCLALGYLLKNLYRVGLLFVQTRFAFQMQAEISRKLYRKYLFKPYAFHLQRNSAELIRNITAESDLFSLLVLLPFLLIGAETIVAVAIFTFLLFVDFRVTLAILFVFGGFSLAFYLIVRNRLVRWGKARQLHDVGRLKQAQQGLSGIKDVRVLGREPYFFHAFATHAIERSRYAGYSFFLNQVPIVWLETVAIVSVVTLFSILVARGVAFDQVLPVLALFAAAALRIMPSFNKILGAGQQLRYAKPVIDTLHAELAITEEDEEGLVELLEPDGSEFQSLSIRDVVFRYPGAEADALKNVNAHISRGQSVGIIGTTGSGKTTMIDLLLGLLRPTEGDILADEKSIFENTRAWQRKIGYVPQSIYLADQTLRENVAFGVPPSEIDDEAVLRAVRMAQLEPLIDGLSKGLETEVGERGVRLSGGQRQRVGIARALYHDPQLIVLDEATAALDTETEQTVMEAVRSLSGKKTLVMIAHRLTTVSACDIVYRLEGGRVIWSGKLEMTDVGIPLPSAATGLDR